MAAENRFVVFVLISFNGIEGILKDNATTLNTKMQQKVVKVFNNYNNLKFTSYSYELQAKSDKLPFPSMFIDTS